jgi:hypothetical protein
MDLWQCRAYQILMTLIIGHRYVTVWAHKRTFEEILEAAIEFVENKADEVGEGDPALKPFVVLTMQPAAREAIECLIEKELVDIVLED